MTEISELTFEKLIHTYIRAKDENRPHMLACAFTPDAVLEMDVRATTIDFPPITKGLASITDVLRKFSQTYENIYTFCLAHPWLVAIEDPHYSFDWMVGMSEKNSGDVYVGCGRYDWYRSDTSGLIAHFKITIEAMQVLPGEHLQSVLDWLAEIPYPWCTAGEIIKTAPGIEMLEPVINYINRLDLHNQGKHPADT